MDPQIAAAVAAVRQAAVLCRAVQSSLAPDALEKRDKSPVTVADFGSQALVCRALAEHFADDPVVGEEDSSDLAGDAQAEFRSRVVGLVSDALGSPQSDDVVLDWIGRGRGQAGVPRFWTLDPIDGTKGFLRGDHYAIALALVENGQPTAAALGCPHLKYGDELGALFVAQAGQGARVMSLFTDADDSLPITVSPTETRAELRFVESVESGHSDHGKAGDVAQHLGMKADSVRLDSQAKYAAVGRGDAEIYLRLPTRKDYREKIWDHAAGALVVTEAGGTVTDVDGEPLEFGSGRTLTRSRGVVATNGRVHAAVIEALRHVGI